MRGSESNCTVKAKQSTISSSANSERPNDSCVRCSFLPPSSALKTDVGGNQRDADRAKAQKKAAALGKNKPKESATSLAKVCYITPDTTSLLSSSFRI